MGKASDMGRAWASELKPKQWLRWIGGDSPLPDVRSRKVVATTAGIGLVLVALAWFTLGAGGGKPATGIKPTTPAPQSSPFVPPRNAAQHGFFDAPTKASATTTSSTSTTVLSAGGTSKRAHSHTRHTGDKRAHTRGLG